MRVAPLLYGIGGIALLPLGSAVAQTITIDLAGGGSVTRSVFNLFLVSTVLALAPAIVVVMTSFTRLIVVFSLLRSAIGLQQAPPNIVLTSLAIFMSMFIMARPIDAAIQRGIEPYLSGKIDEMTALSEVTGPFRRFMLSNTRTVDLDIFIGFSKQNNSELQIEQPEEASLLRPGLSVTATVYTTGN